MRIGWVWIATGMLVLFASGCVSAYDPDVHPTRLEPIKQSNVYEAVDLDGDGRDELVRRGETPGGRRQSVVLRTQAGRAVAQILFEGRLLDLKFADVTQDGRLEIVVPVVQPDSLFYNIVSANGEVLTRFLAVTSEERRVLADSSEWDVRSANLELADVTGDGRRELVSFFRTGFARQPRGVWVHTYPEGERVGYRRIGAMHAGSLYFGDVDGNGAPEWLFGSRSTNNGAEGSGLSDDRAYLGAITVTDSPRVAWAREMGKMFSRVKLRHGDLDGDTQPEFLAIRTPREGRQTKSPLHQVDPATGATIQTYVPSAILWEVRVGDLNGDGRDEIVAWADDGSLLVLNAEFDVQHRRLFEGSLQRIRFLPDVNGDNRDELLVETEEGTLWLGTGLSTLAFTEQTGKWDVLRTGPDRPPHLTMDAGEGRMTQFRVEDHPWWWVYRYGPAAGLTLGLVVVLGTAVLLRRRYRRFKLREAVHDQVAAHSTREWLLAHPRDGVQEASAGARDVLGVDPEQTIDRHTLREQCPDLAAHLDTLARTSGGVQSAELTVDGEQVTVACSPLEVRRAGRAYWLVWLEPESEVQADYQAQSLMAQRVAHDLKNPLTSIRLTLQRMQMAYHDADSDLTETLDEYTERLEERISSLRRMTTNVLKFVGKEDPRHTPTDLRAFLEEVSTDLENNLPPDIDLQREIEGELPAIAVDQDQMRSVVENLAGNAIEAMPEGGVLTLSARLARDLYFEGEGPGDYVVVEVLDTGVGMTPAEQKRLFDPGFSTRGDTGLGMALVRKTVDDHGGRIEVESEPDVGTSITLYLPVDAGADSSA